MAKSVAVAAMVGLVGSALGFQAPAPLTSVTSGSSKVSMMAEMSKSVPFLSKPPLLDGTLAGDEGFDPLRLSEINDVGIDLYWLREAEMKHGRVAMMAAAGVMWVELFGSLPGMPSAEGASQMDVFWTLWAEKPALVGASLVFFTIIELTSGYAITAGREAGREPGDWGYDPTGLTRNEKTKKDLQLKEIRNGRLAMFAAAGQILQGLTTHQPAFENFKALFTWNL
uniref:Uncharacterized protein n=1 Tax=Fibrocapsa japonica TaxID=94617 RepID=A0A7S2V5J8_9STRA|mmetsp:Transcript_3957/g.5898  ORF Transcript_3957/g.5898 Transcript_3957/m.5898 type:complete len:226 (+) Transcript_3957:164-841(+)|eukprot:CAMPEP_0113935678 /NCGR_PEP_ID=MMETSP1339-20121228/2784_1 /TAXON_ID=94617 /ORGANISM="Fibrocapsa japonica" /LENGTH=225 /DNA_ID=CAMNT_0000937913 /DNA_START=147 /DNA_END=824 /DNA_ORIENTATION=+ /assembly_acc=CAM_ASM_000762